MVSTADSDSAGFGSNPDIPTISNRGRVNPFTDRKQVKVA